MGIGQAGAFVVEQLRYGRSINSSAPRQGALTEAAFAKSANKAAAELLGTKAFVNFLHHLVINITFDEKS